MKRDAFLKGVTSFKIQIFVTLQHSKPTACLTTPFINYYNELESAIHWSKLEFKAKLKALKDLLEALAG